MAGYKRKAHPDNTASNYSSFKRNRGVVRRSMKSYPIYQSLTTAPAPTRVELKYDDGTLSTAISSTPGIILLSTIAVGSDAFERIGRRIKYHDMEMRWHWRFSANHGGPNHCKFAIVYDSGPNGVAPAYLDIYESTGVESLQNPNTRGRFKILFESHATSACNDPLGTGNMTWTNFNGKKMLSLKGKGAQYIGITNGIASIEKGAIYLVTNSVQNNVCSLDFKNRIQFTDA